MKKGSVVITRENFGEYAKKVCQLEYRRGKLLAGRRWADITGNLALLFVLLSLILTDAYTDKLLVSPQLQFLGGLATSFWENAENIYESFLAEGYPDLAVALMMVFLSMELFPLAVYLVTALAVELTYSEAPVPLEGSDTERAVRLRDRCGAATASLPVRKILFPMLCAAVFLLATIMLSGDVKDISEALMSYAFLYGFFRLLLWLAGLPYRVRPQPGLKAALDSYAKACKEQEEAEERARREEEEAREARERAEQAERDRRQGDELYRQATAGGSSDEDLILQAAELGCRPACLHMGRELMEAFGSDSYTKSEKAEIAELAKEYLETAAVGQEDEADLVEARFLLLSIRAMTESGNLNKWKSMLSQLRSIRDSGKLPEHFRASCAQLIDLVVVQVDNLEEQTSYSSYPSYSTGYSGGYSAPFDARSYVQETCGSQIYGIVSSSDLGKIDSDPSLTSAQKEAAKTELRRQADMYY